MNTLYVYLLKFLNRQIHYPEKTWTQIIISLLSCLVIFSFLTFYTPFGFNEILDSKYYLALILSFLSSLNIFLVLFASPFFFSRVNLLKRFNNLTLISLFVIIIILNGIVNYPFLKTIMPAHLMKIEIGYANMLLDIIFFPGMLIINLVNWKKKEIVIIEIPFSDKLLEFKDITNRDSQILIQGNDHSIIFGCQIDEFIYASSNENYTEIYVLVNDVLTRSIIRVTFMKLLEVLQDYPQIIRCHRTKIVNLQYITGIEKKSNNNFIRLKHVSEAVPVSRKYPIERHFHDL